MDSTNVYSYVRYLENRYKFSYTQMSKYVNWSLSETIQTIYAYLNSKHISGEKDSLGRDKPFFNIVIAMRNIWFRATDIDRKDILIRETDSKHVVPAFLATVKLQEWMRRERYGVFLNDWGLTLAGFGSCVSKWVDKGNKLDVSVVPWNEIICDSINFEQNAKIQIFEFTIAELKQKKEYDQAVVDSLITARMTRLTITGQIVDVKPEYVRVYEVHGMFPDSYLSGDEKDKDTFSQQMHVISYVRSGNDGKFKDFRLYAGKEANDPYMLTTLLKEDGRVIGIGAVEHLFQAQWMVNHSAKSIKDQLDLASKLIFQTSDPTFSGQNVLTAIENGQILTHKVNEPVTGFPNGSHDTESLTNYMQTWKSLGSEINGISDAMLGNRPHSGTSWKLQNLQLQESQALFDTMKQNKGLSIEDMLRERVIPFIKKQLKTTKEIVAILDAHNIRKIDSLYIPQEAIKRYNRKVIDSVLKTGKLPNASLQNELAQVQSEQNNQGNTRYFKPSDISSKTWNDIFKDLEWDVSIDITGEDKDTNAIMQTLSTALQIVMNPAYAQNPQAQMIVQKILLASSVVSPLEVSTTPPPPAQPLTPTLGYTNPPVPSALASAG